MEGSKEQPSYLYAELCRLLLGVCRSDTSIQDRRVRILLLVFSWLRNLKTEFLSPSEIFSKCQLQQLIWQIKAYKHLLLNRTPLSPELVNNLFGSRIEINEEYYQLLNGLFDTSNDDISSIENHNKNEKDNKQLNENENTVQLGFRPNPIYLEYGLKRKVRFTYKLPLHFSNNISNSNIQAPKPVNSSLSVGGFASTNYWRKIFVEQQDRKYQLKIQKLKIKIADSLSANKSEITRKLKYRLKLLLLKNFQHSIRNAVFSARFFTKIPSYEHDDLTHLPHDPVLSRKHSCIRSYTGCADRLREKHAALYQKRKSFISDVVEMSKRFQNLYYKESVRNRNKRIANAVSKYFSSLEKKELHYELAAQKERLDALRANDEEAYLKLLQNTKNERLLNLVKQTEDYMERVSQLVLAHRINEQGEKNNNISNKNKVDISSQKLEKDMFSTDSGQTNSKHSLINTKEKYYSITHTINEEIQEIPKCLKGGTLREYQLKGLSWLVSLYNNGLNGILADAMGLGKTVQTVSLLAYLNEVKSCRGPHLIVAPLSTLHTNWEAELNRWLPDIPICVYEGSRETRKMLRNRWLNKNSNIDKARDNVDDYSNNSESINNSSMPFQILLTTDAFIIRDKQHLRKFKWEYLIVDEAHRLKNPKSKLVRILQQGFSIRRRLALTGTPLQNDLHEVWALLNFLMPSIFNSSASFDEWFNAPLGFHSSRARAKPKDEAGSCSENEDGVKTHNTGTVNDDHHLNLSEEEKLLIIDRLHKVLRPFLLRREKKEVAHEVPEKQEQLLWCPLSGAQQRLYREVERNPGGQNKMIQLRKICNHPYLFVNNANGFPYETGYHSDESVIRLSGKFFMLDNILQKLKAAGHRVLIFSQMTRLLDLLECMLNLRNLLYLRLDGTTCSDLRRKRLDLYNEPGSKYFAFILSTKAGGLGINLQSADTVIIFDSDWNPQNDEQAQSRAHRIGQKREVLSLRLITPGTVEEVILETAGVKLQRDDLIIKSGMYHDCQASNSKDLDEERKQKVKEILRRPGNSSSLLNSQTHIEGFIRKAYNPDLINKFVARNERDLEIFELLDKHYKMMHVPPLITDDVLPPCLFSWLAHDKNREEKNSTSNIHDTKERLRVWKAAYSVGEMFVAYPKDVTTNSYELDLRKYLLNECIKLAIEKALENQEFYHFWEYPSPTQLKDYYECIKNPICLQAILTHAKNYQYISLFNLEKHLERMCTNARLFNGSDSLLYFKALECTGEVMLDCRRTMSTVFHFHFHKDVHLEKYKNAFFTNNNIVENDYNNQTNNNNNNNRINWRQIKHLLKPDLQINYGTGVLSSPNNHLITGNVTMKNQQSHEIENTNDTSTGNVHLIKANSTILPVKSAPPQVSPAQVPKFRLRLSSIEKTEPSPK